MSMSDRERGAIEDVFVPRTTTDRHGLPSPRSGTELDVIRHARGALLAASRTNEPSRIAEACLDLVGKLVEQHRVLAASWVLENTIEGLERTELETPGSADALWGLDLALAMVYDRLGKAIDARSMARRGLSHAIRANSDTGRARSREVIQRLTSAPEDRPTQRFARPNSQATGRTVPGR